MGDGTADGTGESESGVESNTGELLRLVGLNLLLDGINGSDAG